MQQTTSNPICIALVCGVLFCLTVGCRKNDNNDNPNPNGKVPLVTTVVVIDITPTTATCGGSVTSDGGAPVIARGVCWSTVPIPETTDAHTFDGTGTGSFTSSLIGLLTNRLYYVRAYATNSIGTAYSDQVSFTANYYDIDGNVFHTIQIGTQEWMLENLKVTRFNDGTEIPLVEYGPDWSNLTTSGYCWYNNDPIYKDPYGALYNGYAMGNPKLCPPGWHVPDIDEWMTLVTYLGGDFVAGGCMKEAGLVHPASPNTGATNSSAFTALPAGSRFGDGNFNNLTWNTNYWIFDTIPSIQSDILNLVWQSAQVFWIPRNKTEGNSVRCIRDK